MNKEEAQAVHDGILPYITFYSDKDNTEVVGELFAKGGEISFKGKATESAQLFFDELKEQSLKFLVDVEAML